LSHTLVKQVSPGDLVHGGNPFESEVRIWQQLP